MNKIIEDSKNVAEMVIAKVDAIISELELSKNNLKEKIKVDMENIHTDIDSTIAKVSNDISEIKVKGDLVLS